MGRGTWDQAEAVGLVRALIRTRAGFDVQLAEAVREASELGVPKSMLADVLGVHRATLYRQFGSVMFGTEEPGSEGVSSPSDRLDPEAVTK
jgi:hypothetical protein